MTDTMVKERLTPTFTKPRRISTLLDRAADKLEAQPKKLNGYLVSEAGDMYCAEGAILAAAGLPLENLKDTGRAGNGVTNCPLWDWVEAQSDSGHQALCDLHDDDNVSKAAVVERMRDLAKEARRQERRGELPMVTFEVFDSYSWANLAAAR